MTETILYIKPVRSLRKMLRTQWRWVLVHSNGNTLATDGTQGYANRHECEQVAFKVVGGKYSYSVVIEGSIEG